MIKTILKLTILVIVVLLLGQIRWGGTALAERFQQQVTQTLRKGGEAIEENRFVAKLTRRLASKETPRAGEEKIAPETETLTDADRESLRRLLQ
jgi:hypothetical protein